MRLEICEWECEKKPQSQGEGIYKNIGLPGNGGKAMREGQDRKAKGKKRREESTAMWGGKR